MGNYQGRNRQNSQQLDISYSNEFELSADGGDGEEDKCLSKKVNEKKSSSSNNNNNKKKSSANTNDWKYVLDNDDDEDVGVFNSGNSCVEEKEALFNNQETKPSQSDDLDLDYHTTEDDDQQFKKNSDKLNGDSMRNLIDDAPLLPIDADDVDDGVYMSKCLNDNNKHSSTETVTSTTTRSSSSPSSLASSNRGVNLIDDGDDIDKFIRYELSGKSTTGVRPTTAAAVATLEQRTSGIDDFDSDIEKLKSSLLLGSKLGEVSAKAKLHSTSESLLSPIPPPPCTPVSGPLSIVDKDAVIQQTLATSAPAYRNQQLIEDVILLDESDRGLVPLAQQEEHSFNSLDSSSNNPPTNGQEEVSTQNLELLLEQLNINPEPVVTKPEPSEQQQVNPLTKLLNQLASTNLIAHRFEYMANELVNDVKLTGSFNNWSEFLQLTKDDQIENKWFRDIYLAPGEYEFKYKVNDEWKCDENGEMRGINNYLNLAKP